MCDPSDPYDHASCMPSVKEVLADLPRWEDAIGRLNDVLEEARAQQKALYETARSVDGWTYHTADCAADCENEDCLRQAVGTYRRVRQDSFVTELCETCFACREELEVLVRNYVLETCEDTIRRAKDDDEWRTIAYNEAEGVRCLYERDECACYDSDGRLCEHADSYTLRGTHGLISVCERCWDEHPITRNEEIADAIMRRGEVSKPVERLGTLARIRNKERERVEAARSVEEWSYRLCDEGVSVGCDNPECSRADVVGVYTRAEERNRFVTELCETCFAQRDVLEARMRARKTWEKDVENARDEDEWRVVSNDESVGLSCAYEPDRCRSHSRSRYGVRLRVLRRPNLIRIVVCEPCWAHATGRVDSGTPEGQQIASVTWAHYDDWPAPWSCALGVTCVAVEHNKPRGSDVWFYGESRRLALCKRCWQSGMRTHRVVLDAIKHEGREEEA
jgi:hypothetical protein